MPFNQKKWKLFEVERAKFSFAPILLREFCVLFTQMQEANNKKNKGATDVDLTELKLK